MLASNCALTSKEIISWSIISLYNYIINTFKYLFIDDYLFGVKAARYPRWVTERVRSLCQLKLHNKITIYHFWNWNINQSKVML